MTTKTLEDNPLKASRWAGLLYVLIAVCGPFAILYVPSVAITFGDANQNAVTMTQNEGLFRMGILVDMIIIGFEVVLTSILYNLFRPVSGTAATMAMLARFGMIVVMALNLINYLVPLHLVSGPDYLAGFSIEQVNALALLFLEAHELGVYAWQIFFGLHLIALGYLVWKSEALPKLIGAGLVIGSLGYLLQTVEKYVVPGNEALTLLVTGLLVIVSLAEVSLGLWLLIRGINVKKWEARGFASA